MASDWATSGVDLHLEVDRTHLRRSLEDSLRSAVRDGRLVPGVVLPPSRALARDLQVARNTVADAYGQLVAEGWLESRQGSATRVAAVPPAARAARVDSAAQARGPAYDLRPGRPDVSGFPRTAWATAVREVLAQLPSEALGYGDARGRVELRTALAEYLGRARGVRTDPACVVVCSGYAEALWLLGRALRARGVRAAGVEAYGHQRHRAVLSDAGLRLDAVEVDEEGARVSALGAAGAVVLTPAHQFPLGWALSPDRRLELVGWARDSGAVVIEDDYDAEFRYDRRAVGALQPLAPDVVVHAGTASKTLAPAVRLAWLALPPSLVDDVVAQRELLARETPVIDQLALARLLVSGRYDRHVRRSRLAYARRRESFVAALDRHAPAVEVIGLAAGLHSVVRLAPGDEEEAAVARAAARDVAIEGLASYSAPGFSQPPSVVVGWGGAPPHTVTTALRRLALALGG
ncbi:MAG: aminotransferase class I/II-fold pyridoxal phosphate-dependent enzyme [Frankiales bacterium]|nr:aminotransferase class I/II-fold pyridoxal phosphate-dependent enzyme [Frankiales bacterium]